MTVLLPEPPKTTASSPPSSCNTTSKPKGKNQFADITVDYKKSKQLPYRVLSEAPTFMNLLGNNLGSQNVMDLACGEGHYTRMIRKITKGNVTGVDISPEQIDFARRQELSGGQEDTATTATATTTTTTIENHNHIDYVVQDCCHKDFMAQFDSEFDVVTATYLLNYATEETMIEAFVESAFALLKPGGRFVGINTSPFVRTQGDFSKTHKYHVVYNTEREECQNGDPLLIQVEGKDFKASFYNYFWTTEVYEKAFAKAGFTQFRWVPLEVMAEDESEWADWKEFCPIICFEAIKPV